MMKKLVSLLLVLLMLVPVVSAGAESRLSSFWDAAEQLLFSTGNATLTGEAEFSLDGQWFKTAKIRYVQDGDSSFWKLDLTAPRSDGGLIENGYTIVANGERYFVMEAFYPGTYKSGWDTAQDTILRRSVMMDRMADLVRLLADQADTLLGGEAVSFSAVGDTQTTVRILLEEDVPPLVDTALNLLAQYAAKRYFHTDYDYIEDRYMVSMEDYFTVTQAILGCTKSVSLKKADVAMTKGASGLPEQVAGEASVILHTGADGDRLLSVAFRLDVTDVGSSVVEEFDPADYGVVLPEAEPEAEPERNTNTAVLSAEESARYIEEARAAWLRSGYAGADTLDGAVRVMDGGYSYTELANGDGTVLLSCFADAEGKILELHNEINGWQRSDVEYSFTAYPDAGVVQEAEDRAMQYLADIAPDALQRVGQMQVQWWLEYEGETILCLMEDPIAQDWDGVMVVVRVKPDWQIEYFSCISNG